MSFDLAPRKSIIGDGALSEDGEVDFFPGAQVSIAPVEETINGRIVIDASDSVQGIVHAPYSFTLKNGVITAIEGGKEADVMRNWLETRNDEKIYRLCHFSVGLNPQAGISGNMIEDERKLAAVDLFRLSGPQVWWYRRAESLSHGHHAGHTDNLPRRQRDEWWW